MLVAGRSKKVKAGSGFLCSKITLRSVTYFLVRPLPRIKGELILSCTNYEDGRNLPVFTYF